MHNEDYINGQNNGLILGLSLGTSADVDIGMGNADFVTMNKTPSQAVIDELPNNTLVVVYGTDTENGRFGETAFQTAQRVQGFSGTKEDWIASLNGHDAARVAIHGGFQGTEAEYNNILVQVGQLPTLFHQMVGLGANILGV